MHEPLKNRIYLRKKMFFIFFGTNFRAPKCGQRHEKQPALELEHIGFVKVTLLSKMASEDVWFELLSEIMFFIWFQVFFWSLKFS